MQSVDFVILGGSGFIGSYLSTELIKLGASVRVVDNALDGVLPVAHLLSSNKFEYIRGDVRDTETVRDSILGAKTVVPLAAIVGAPSCEKDPDAAYQVNEKAIVDLASLLERDQHVIYLNTNSGYGVGYSLPVYDEMSPLNPSSIYGITKKNAECCLLERENTISLRLASVFGCSFRRRDDLLLHFFVKQAIENQKISIFEPEYKRNFVHVKDVCRSIIFMAKNFLVHKSNIFNVVLNEENITKMQLANVVASVVRDVKIETINGPMDADKRNYVVTSNKLLNTGFDFKLSISDGVKEMSKFYSGGTY